MQTIKDFNDYELIDASLGMKYERWGKYYLLRPDPEALWDNGDLSIKYNGKIDAIYHRSNTGGGHWENLKKVPESWSINYKDLTFNIKQMGFKHTGLFPEQAVNWEFMSHKIKNADREISVLNLFAYTGGATVVCSKAGASVVHVDASRGMTDWAKENANSSGLSDRPIRYLVDDCIKFVKREIRRGHKYDAIIMDPPSYGRGSNGEVWNFSKDILELINLCMKILSDKPLFFQINSYTTGISPTVLENILRLKFKNYDGVCSSSEIGIPLSSCNLVLPCGIYGRWESND